MSGAEIAVVRRFVEEYQNTGDERVAQELLAPEFVDHSPFGPFSPDRDGVLALFRMLRGAFPDLHAEIHDQMHDNGKVTTRKTIHGTHQGDFMGIPPTGRAVSMDVIDIVRVSGGRMVEHRNVVDAFGLMTQLGAVGADA